MKIIGEIMERYDTDKMIPLYGFGGTPKDNKYQKVSHCIALNGDIGSPEVNGSQGLLDCYKNAIGKIKLDGPTHFNELLDHVNSEAEQSLKEQSQINQQYFVLLILTDGSIMDRSKTIQ
jgi:hypothetical protein